VNSVDVIIVNWNSRDETLACLEAVTAQARDVEGAAVTVVDNGSTDGSIAAIRARFPAVRFIPLPENRGFTGGLAAGLLRCTARNVVFLNNDAIPERGWLAASLRAIDDAPEDVVSVGGKIVDPTGKRIDFIGGVMTFDGHGLQNGFRYPLGSRPEPADGEEIFFACGGNMISRRETLLELGGFDDDYFAYLEDVDFGWRTWLSGRRALFAPKAIVRHKSSSTSERLGNFERGVLFERNAFQTALKNHEDAAAINATLFAYLHRLHHYATAHNKDAKELTRPAMTKPPRRRRAVIDDALTAMQFRALDWIVKHSAGIAEKRAAVQRMRRRSDREIFERFPLHFVATYPGDAALMKNPLFAMLRPDVRSVDAALGDIIRT
jgi:GT2 family glycosyltransferase